jgi:hypothetical protein
MLAEDVSRVQGTTNPMEGDKLASNGLLRLVKGQCVVSQPPSQSRPASNFMQGWFRTLRQSINCTLRALLSGLQLSELVVLDPGTLSVVPGVSLIRGEAFLQQGSISFVPRGPLGLDPSWISLEAQPTFVVLFKPQPLGPGAQSGADSVA